MAAHATISAQLAAQILGDSQVALERCRMHRRGTFMAARATTSNHLAAQVLDDSQVAWMGSGTQGKGHRAIAGLSAAW